MELCVGAWRTVLKGIITTTPSNRSRYRAYNLDRVPPLVKADQLCTGWLVPSSLAEANDLSRLFDEFRLGLNESAGVKVIINPLRTVGHRPKRIKLHARAPPKGVEKHCLPLAPWGHFVGKGLTL
jgi:hypothetical protein